ncbi:hypothetical protein C8J57DRAFT_1064839 [Mycena rebaudengoi]|nr:hypothetical protein C8J57DRAFT_1064839 [Mycena rebaudengoi]
MFSPFASTGLLSPASHSSSRSSTASVLPANDNTFSIDPDHPCPLCSVCARSFRGRILKCSDCHDDLIICEECCLRSHEWLPLHRPEEWHITSWRTICLTDIGFVYQLGHDRSPCPCPTLQPISMQVLDVSGLHRIQCRFCGCDGAGSELNQLLWNQWYPAASVHGGGRTCATFKTLDMFWHLYVAESKAAIVYPTI